MKGLLPFIIPRGFYKRKWLVTIFFPLSVFLFMSIPITAFAADCVDSDGDGYVATCSGCDLPSGKLCGDCNDGDAAIHPGHAEICGDGKDNDCVGGGQLEPGGDCLVCPTGDPGSDCDAFASGICRSGNVFTCSGDLLSLECLEPAQGYDYPSIENWSVPATCTDGNDNDCDGNIDDLDTPDCGIIAEVCDGYDNDWDGFIDEGFGIGITCTSGDGECERTGVLACKEDWSGSECTAVAGSPKAEIYGIANRCDDLLDNDCDGFIDIADAGCGPPASFELCDGIDNDLDLDIDEGYYYLGDPIGDPCNTGVGDCYSDGFIVCAANQLEAECDASAGTPTEETEIAGTCKDLSDNDCDGLTDENDPSCGAAINLEVTCALPYTHGKPGDDCGGKHIVAYEVYGDSEFTDVYVELLALTTEGELIDLITGVEAGDQVHMVSRIYPEDYKLESKTNVKGTRHEVFAPVPMLRVTAQEGDSKAVAYCTSIPYLQVMKPDGEVISVSSDDTVEVITALPGVNPNGLIVWVDGVDILAAMGIDPALDFPGGPFSSPPGGININGQMVDVENLVVESAGVEDFSSNTLTMTLKNLGGGGHIIYVADETIYPPVDLSPDCHDDDLADAGTVSALEVEILLPLDQAIVDPVPPAGVAVSGEVRHGREIAGLKLNGANVVIPPLSSGPDYVFTPGNGMTTADQYVFYFNEPLAEAGMDDLIAGTAAPGTVQRGSNKVTADASDDLGNRAFDTQMFAVGNTLAVAQIAAITLQVEDKLQPLLMATKIEVMNSITATVDNAFVAGLEEGAVDTVFQNACTAAAAEFESRLKAKVNGMDLGTVTADPDCSCTVTANLKLDYVKLIGNPVCDAAFSEGQIDVTFALPDVEIKISAHNSCKVAPLGVCFTKTVIDVWAITKIPDPVFSFTITEEQIETNTPPPDEMKSFVYGTLRYPGSNGESLENDSDVWHSSSSTHCWGAGVCGFFQGLTAVLVEVFTFGIVDGGDLFDWVTLDFDLVDFENVTGSTEPDPVKIGEMRIDPQIVENYGRAKFTPTLSDVDITTQGLTASFSAAFETQSVDPDTEENPGAADTPAPPPSPDLGTTPENAFMVLADDTINQLFASMADSGLKTECEDTGSTIGDLLPTDCESLTGDTDLATASIQGFCHGIRNADCETLTNSSALLQGTEQGVCHGVQGANCDTLSVVGSIGERLVCGVTPVISLEPTDPLLFCSRQSIPPQFVLNDNSMTAPVESSLLLNDMTVAMVVDRPANGQLDGELADIPNCFAAEASSLVDCNLFTACVDITLNTLMSLDNANAMCPNDPAFVFDVTLPVITSGLQAGVVCGQAATQTDDETVTGLAAADETVEEISENTAHFAPPLCAKGLDLGGLFNFVGPKLISIDTGGPDSYGDYFGITGEIQ